MGSWTACYVEMERRAIRELSDTGYKVLRYLSSRGDELGRCYPTQETIANDCNRERRAIGYALEELEAQGYIAYLQRAGRDGRTGRWQNNVYMINPAYITIRDELIPNANALWDDCASENHRANPGANGTEMHTNQQQEPATRINDIEPTTGTNNNNHAQGGKKREKPLEDGAVDVVFSANYTRDERKDNIDTTTQDEDATRSPDEVPPPAQRSRKRKQQVRSTSSRNVPPPPATAPPPPAPARLPDPDPVRDALDDAVAERLAQRVRGIGIPIAMARGLVVAYGVTACEQGLITTSKTPNAKNPAGLFRSILQKEIQDDFDDFNVKASAYRWDEDGRLIGWADEAIS